MTRIPLLPRALVAWLCLLCVSVEANNTGGIFGPSVSAGHRSAQVRGAYDLDSHAFAQRIHYQQALNGDLMARGIVQARKTNDRDIDPEHFQAELFWQLEDLSQTWRHGLRFDLRIRTEGRPRQAGFNWTNEFDLEDGWTARFIVLTSTQFGDNAPSGVLVGTRGRIAYKASPRLSLMVDMFSGYGKFDDIRSFDNQSHQIGPAVNADVADGWQVFGGVLFGLTDATPDTQARLWLIRRF